MVEELRKYLYNLMSNIQGLTAIVVSDREGVPVLKTIKEETPEFALSAAYLSNFQITSDICGKLGFGSCNYICCNYDNLSVVHYSKKHLIISYIATEGSNLGQILNLHKEVYPYLRSIEDIVEKFE